MRAASPRTVLILTLVLIVSLSAAVLIQRGVARVPEGRFGVAGSRVLGPGLHLVAPWSRPAIYPAGEVSVEAEADALTAEGARVSLSWSARVSARTADAARLPARSASGEPASGFALDLAAGVQQDLLDPAGSATPLALRVREALASRGVDVLSLEVAPRAAGSVAGPTAAAPRGPRPAPIALIGLDGADWQIIDPLIDAGRLPHMARLKSRARWGHLRSFEPILSPLLWTTAATGKPPDEHGIVDFLVTDPATGAKTPITSRSRRVKALWNIFSDHGLTVDAVAWWASWPAEPVRGRMVSDRLAYSLFEVASTAQGLTWPAEMEKALRPLMTTDAAIDHAAIRRFVDVTPEEFEAARARAASDPERAYKEPVNHLARILASTRTYHRATLRLLDDGQPDLLAVYYQGIDEVSHRFAHFMPPCMAGVSAADFDRYHRAVEAFYVYQDELLGEILGRLAPSTRVLVMSDHGFHNGPSRPTDGPADIEGKPGKWHRLYGIVMAAGEGIEPGRFDTATLYDITPTVLALAGLPAARDMKGKSLIDVPAAAASIATYETPGRGPAPPSAVADAGEADAELLRNLASLGYIGSASAPAAPGSPLQASAGSMDPSSVTAHTNLAAVLMQKGDLAGAETELRQALSAAPGYFPALMSLGQVLVKQGRIDEALKTTRHAVARSDDADAGAYVQLTLLAFREGQTAQAANFLMSLRQRRPKSPGIDTGLGVLAAVAGDTAAAERFYRAALALDPACQEPLGRLFTMYREAGREAELEPEVRRALERNERSVLHLNWMGLIRMRRGDPAGAEADFKRALELAPDFGGTMANLGSLYGREGRLEEAVQVLSRALRIEPLHKEARVNLGATLAKLGRYDEAIESLAQARALGMRSPEVLNAMGLAYAQSGRTREAIDALKESLSVSPRQPQVEALLAELTQAPP